MFRETNDSGSDEGAERGPTGPLASGTGIRPLRRGCQPVRKAAATCVVALAAVSLVACGSSSSKTATPSGSSSPTNTKTSSFIEAANVKAAEAAVRPYSVAPKAFPVTQPLPTKLPAGKKFVYLQCGTPICAEVGELLKPAVQALGSKFIVVNVGNTAQTAQAAVSSVAAMKPDAVLLGAIDPSLFGSGLKTLAAGGAKLVSLQLDENVKQFGITFNYLGVNLSQRNGMLLADWVIAHKGPKANVVLYTLPALNISAPVQASFLATMTENCTSCKVRVVPIDATTIGTTAPSTVVTDLQSHPSTNTAVFVSLSAAEGLPAAMKSAGVKVTTLGFGPTAGNLQDIKDGALTATLDIDFPVSTWTAVDAAARLLEGSHPTANEQNGIVPEEFLEQKQITFNPAEGWTAFPTFAQRFAQLWHLK
jgi:ribose transport system substrate-binding protein